MIKSLTLRANMQALVFVGLFAVAIATGCSDEEVAPADTVDAGDSQTGDVIASDSGPDIDVDGDNNSSEPASPPAPGDWTLAFHDEFAGTAVDTEKWTEISSSQSDGQQGNCGSNFQREWNQLDNAEVVDGRLVITARREDISSPSGCDYQWTSALLTTRQFEFTYGYIEERARFPKEVGFWPAFWAWQVPGADETMETDVYEYYSDNPILIYLTSHVGDGGGCTVSLSDMDINPSESFNTYGADIGPDGTTWYINGVEVCDAPGAPSAPPEPDHEYGRL